MNPIRRLYANGIGAAKAVLFLLLIAVLMPVALLYRAISPAHAFDIPQLFHRIVLRLLGITVVTHGGPARPPVLFACNHASYLDIVVLGALLPTSFVAKSEVATWPLFGWLAKIQNTLFVERRSSQAAAQHKQLRDYFSSGRNLVLFPEGTSSNGLTALRFKSSLFSIVEEMTVNVQPVSITCTRRDGKPLSLQQRDLYAWYGDMTLLPHLWNVFKYGHFTVDVIFHPVLAPQDASDRKLAAAACQAQVARGIERSLAGAAI